MDLWESYDPGCLSPAPYRSAHACRKLSLAWRGNYEVISDSVGTRSDNNERIVKPTPSVASGAGFWVWSVGLGSPRVLPFYGKFIELCEIPWGSPLSPLFLKHTHASNVPKP